MPLSDHVSLTISKNTVGIARAGFGVPLILSAQATWTERVRYYTDITGVAADWPITTGPEYLAAQALFAQTPKPKKIAIGRSANKPTQAYQLNVSTVAANNHYLLKVAGQGVTSTEINYLTTSGDLSGTLLPRVSNTLTLTGHGMLTGDGPYRVSNSGGALPTGLTVDTNYWIIAIDANTFQFASTKANALALTPVALSTDGTGTQTIRRVQNDVICAQLVQALNAVVGANYTAVQVVGAGETDYITITANAPGNWFSVGVERPQDMTIKETHADPGVAADLIACALESDGWYALITLYNSQAYVLAAAAWVEANTKIYIADVPEIEAIAVAKVSGADTIKALQSAAYSRTMGAFHAYPSEMFAASWFGRCLPLEPGSETWNDKTLAGPVVDTLTTTNRTNLTDRSGNGYQVVTGLNKTFNGKCADGEFFDTIRGIDWFVDDCTKAIYAVLAGADKIPFEDAGIARIEGALRGSLKRAVQRTIFAADSISIVIPKASDVASSDRANRILSGVSFSARLSGAIHQVVVTGNVTA